MLHRLRRLVPPTARTGLLESSLLTNEARIAGLRKLGVRIGDGALVYAGVRFSGLDVEIGDRCLINRGCFFDDAPIRIGDDVALAPDVMLAGVTHEIGGSERRAGANVWQPIIIEDGSWLGARSIVLGGVTIAAGSVIGAGSLVTRSTEPNGLYVGSPARRVRDLA